MHSVHGRKASLSDPFLRKDNSHSPATKLPPKKMPGAQKPDESDLDVVSGNLNDLAFLRLPDVKVVTGLSKSSLYALIQEKKFPASVRLGARAVGWVRSEVKQWA